MLAGVTEVRQKRHRKKPRTRMFLRVFPVVITLRYVVLRFLGAILRRLSIPLLYPYLLYLLFRYEL